MQLGVRPSSQTVPMGSFVSILRLGRRRVDILPAVFLLAFSYLCPPLLAAGGSSLERTVSFMADDFRIVGTLTEPNSPEPSPIVVILHGMGGNRHGPTIRGTSVPLFRTVARNWAARGVASLTISTGGRGGSEGDYVDMTLERRVNEALAAIDWIVAQPKFDKEKISILGHSQGTLVAASAARRLKAQVPVQSVILWAPQSNALEVYKRSMGIKIYEKGLQSEQNEIVSWYGVGGQLRKFKRAFFTGLRDFNAVMDIGAFGGPTLIVTGLRDRWSPSWRAAEFKASGDQCTFLEFDVGHRMGAGIGPTAVDLMARETLSWLLNLP